MLNMNLREINKKKYEDALKAYQEQIVQIAILEYEKRDLGERRPNAPKEAFDNLDARIEKEYEEFKTFLSLNPNVGDVEPNSGGIRKVRWTSGGRGKSSGVRVIYFNRLENGEIWLLTLYSKKETTQLSKKTLQLLVEKLNDSFNG